MPANERGSASLSIVHRPDQNPKEVFIDGRLDFERDTIDAEPDVRTICAIRAIRTNCTIGNSLISDLCDSRNSHELHDREQLDQTECSAEERVQSPKAEL